MKENEHRLQECAVSAFSRSFSYCINAAKPVVLHRKETVWIAEPLPLLLHHIQTKASLTKQWFFLSSSLWVGVESAFDEERSLPYEPLVALSLLLEDLLAPVEILTVAV